MSCVVSGNVVARRGLPALPRLPPSRVVPVAVRRHALLRGYPYGVYNIVGGGRDFDLTRAAGRTPVTQTLSQYSSGVIPMVFQHSA